MEEGVAGVSMGELGFVLPNSNEPIALDLFVHWTKHVSTREMMMEEEDMLWR